MRPQLIRSVSDKKGNVIRDFKPEAVRRVLRKETARQMRKALAKVVSPQGTASLASVPGYRVAGKTGTAKKHKAGGGYLNGRYVVSFVGMLPADEPRFVCAVVIDDPQTTSVKRYGGTIAAPVFAKVAGRLATKMNIPRTEANNLKVPLAIREKR